MLHAIDLDRDWLSVYFVEVRDGAPTIAEIRVLPQPRTPDDRKRLDDLLTEAAGAGWRPPPPARPLTARLLRHELQPGRALDHVRQALAEVDRGILAVHGLDAEALTAPRRPGRRGRSDRFWAELAAMYAEASANGSRRPVVEVAERLTREGGTYSTSQVRDLIREARRRGMLTPGSRGHAGGDLTERARAVLADMPDVERDA